MTTPDGGKALNFAIRLPKGVVAVIARWNLPLLLMTWKVGPALATQEVKDGLATLASEPLGGTPSELGVLIDKEIDHLGKIARAANVKAD